VNTSKSSEEERREQPRSDTSAQDARELVEQLRSGPVEQIVAEAFFMLLNGAQVKLGRRDARLLIDLNTVMLDYARPYLRDALVTQVEQSLGQLRLGQVSAENAVAAKAEPEPNDLAQVPTPPSQRSGPAASAS
jgi:hypothetical protein